MDKLMRTALYRAGYYRRRQMKVHGLNLGGGSDKLKNYITIDADKNTECDIIAGITKLNFANSTVSNIYTSHTLEHVPRQDVARVLSEWNRVLIPGGKLYVCVPDIEQLTTIYLDGLRQYDKNSFQTDLACEIIFGGQKDKYDFHYHGYSFTTLKKLLLNAHFENIKLFEHKKIKELSNVSDAGATAKINGKVVSLNIIAMKKK